jgi:hypothetical protein
VGIITKRGVKSNHFLSLHFLSQSDIISSYYKKRGFLWTRKKRNTER